MILLGRITSVEHAGEEAKRTEKLQSVVDRINREGRSLAYPYQITEEGVEFQAVYSNADFLFDHIWLILYELYPLRVRFSIGVAAAGTGSSEEQLDGPVFRRVIDGLGGLEKNDRLFGIFGYPGEQKELINCSLALISERVVKWSKKRFAVLYALSRNREIGEVARLLDISERSVYKNINAGSLETILNTVREISMLLDS